MANKKEHEKNSYMAVLNTVSAELSSVRRSQDARMEKYADYYKMLHCERITDIQDIESDIFLPEFVGRVLTIIGEFVARYFSSREFVDVYLTSENPKDVAESKAAKTLLNRLLADEDLYFYLKVVRLLMSVITCGYGVIKGFYRQSINTTQTGQEMIDDYAKDENGQYLAEDGTPFIDQTTQTPQKTQTPQPIIETTVEIDRPDFDVYPIDDVYFSPEYAYSLKEKSWVIFRTYKTVAQLRADQKMCGYIDSALAELEDLEKGSATKSENKVKNRFIEDPTDEDEPSQSPQTQFKIYERWGLTWVADDGTPGVDKDGNPTKAAKLQECIVSWVATGDSDEPELLIRFQKSPFSLRPVVRFQCYVDTIEDRGFGDGEPVRELQIAINDTFNVSNFRTLLATTPAFKGKKFTNLPKKIKVSPRGLIELDEMTDLEELEIKDNIAGAMGQIGMLANRIDTVMATSGMDAGQPPDNRETATMGSILAQRSTMRSGLRTATIEYAGFTELYRMMLSMVNDFMLPKTLEDILGDQAFDYNPKRKDKFVPVSQALETEQSKNFKVKMWDQVLGRVVAVPNPNTPLVINYILGQILETMGGDFKVFKKYMFEEDPIKNALYTIATGAKGGPPAMAAAPTPNMAGGAEGSPQNQTGLPINPIEAQARSAQGAMGFKQPGGQPRG